VFDGMPVDDLHQSDPQRLRQLGVDEPVAHDRRG
jgi:hypothetical protein